MDRGVDSLFRRYLVESVMFPDGKRRNVYVRKLGRRAYETMQQRASLASRKLGRKLKDKDSEEYSYMVLADLDILMEDKDSAIDFVIMLRESKMRLAVERENLFEPEESIDKEDPIDTVEREIRNEELEKKVEDDKRKMLAATRDEEKEWLGKMSDDDLRNQVEREIVNSAILRELNAIWTANLLYESVFWAKKKGKEWTCGDAVFDEIPHDADPDLSAKLLDLYFSLDQEIKDPS